MIQMLKGSEVNPQWLQQICAANPPCQARNPDGSLADNSYLTGPVRLSFVYLMEPRKPAPTAQQPNPTPYFSATALFPPGTDLSVLQNEHARRCREEFPRNVTPDGQLYGLYPTFSDQGSKPQLEGYTPGGVVVEMRANVDHRPQVLDARMNPIVDKSRVYSGVWAVCAGRFYAIGKNSSDPTMKKGVRFGLTNVMIIADDKKLGGSTADAKTQFAGISITQDANVAAEFGGAGQAAVGAYIPSSQPTMAVSPNPAHPLAAAAAAAGMDIETYVMMYGG
jgi:hypothetical protein